MVANGLKDQHEERFQVVAFERSENRGEVGGTDRFGTPGQRGLTNGRQDGPSAHHEAQGKRSHAHEDDEDVILRVPALDGPEITPHRIANAPDAANDEEEEGGDA